MNAVAEALYTPEELLALENGQRLELVEGRLREKPPMGAEANRVATVLVRLLDAHASSQKLGLVFSQECGYQIFPNDARKVRKPDASFIARGRLPNDRPPRGHVLIHPDLITEVVSPIDLAEDIDGRVAEYLGAGVRLVWVIYPATRSVLVLRPDGGANRLTAGQQLSGEDVVQGFRCDISALFANL